MSQKKSYLTCTDQFCGAGGSSSGATAAGVEVKLAMNHWDLAIKTHNTNFPNADHDCADISASNPRRYASTDILITSPECFPAGTLILTKRGFVSIEQVCVDDMVLTHMNRWMPVTHTMTKTSDTIFVKSKGYPPLEVTSGHPFLTRKHEFPNGNVRILHEIEWTSAGDLTKGMMWANPIISNVDPIPVPSIEGRSVEFCEDFWWMVGKWLADGVVTSKKDGSMHVRISCSHGEAEETLRRVNFCPPKQYHARTNEIRWSKEVRNNQVLVTTSYQDLGKWLTRNFGKHADQKQLPAWALTMPNEWKRSLLDGYLFGDGSYDEVRGQYRYATVSKCLAVGFKLLSISLGHACFVGVRSGGDKESINGIEFIRKAQYRGSFVDNPKINLSVRDGNYQWFPVESTLYGRKDVQVYNLSVAEDESYVADGIVVHNCTNHSLAKGKSKKHQHQMDLFGKYIINPDEERSRATMFDVPRFAEYHKYRIIIVENVVDARQWVMWDAWLHAMDSLGYNHHVVYFNSMFAYPTPQSRDRMYVVFWRKGNRAPNLKFTPPAYCPRCERNVEAEQAWKNNRSAGRYKKQYVYACPQCYTTVEPYYYCAANAIDWSIQAPRIGDRAKPLKAKTRHRIQVGLDKFGGRPYLADTIHSARNGRDGDMVWPMTVENRTQFGQSTHALITPPMVVDLAHNKAESGRIYPMTDPSPTQTSYQTMGMVVPPFLLSLNHSTDRAQSVHEASPTIMPQTIPSMVVPPFVVEMFGQSTARSIDAPLGTMMGTEHHGIVTPPFMVDLRGENAPKGMDDTLSTICASGNHHGVVVPFIASYYGTDNVSSVEQATPTVTTRERHSLIVPPPFLLSYYTRTSGVGAALAGVNDAMPTQPTWPVHYLAQPGSVPTIDDCGFRMLQPHEIQRAMAFPDDYVILGNARQKVKQLGNAVTAPVMEMIVRRCIASLEG